MCIAILNTKGTLTEKTFTNCWNENPHGGGIAWAKDGQVHTFKEMKSVKVMYQKYLELREALPDGNFLIHFRIATHGRINETNCHPFKVSNKLAFIHNGMINSHTLGTSPDFSDTYLFNQLVLKKLPRNFINNEAILSMMSDFIGYSKLVFLSAEDDWCIVNESLGIWDGDNWYSNDSYLDPFPVSTEGKAKGKKSGKSCYYDDLPEYQDITLYEPLTHSHCDCCQETGVTTHFIPEWSMEMCMGCIDEFAEPKTKAKHKDRIR